MATTATEQVEEDAADLQFPKDWLNVVEHDNSMPANVCYLCSSVLKEPYIRCAECFSVEICPECFSMGAELGAHRNWHQYIVLKSEFPLFPGSSWSAQEELDLLEGVMDCGLGNWGDVSRRVCTRSPDDCATHYDTFYIRHPTVPDLPKLNTNNHSVSPPCFETRFVESDEPPRYLPGSSSYKALGGYNAARSDFEVEYDNYAETLVSQVEPCLPGDKLMRELQAAVVDMYNRRLKERARRKRVIREHGLIILRKTLSWLHRYEATIPRSVTERLLVFMQLLSGLDLDYLFEGLHHAGELRLYILRLQELRENGLSHFHSCRLYRKLLRLREAHRKEMANPTHLWRTIADPVPGTPAPDKASLPPNVPSRRPAPPLEIVGLPGYERLTPSERQLCSAARLVPESYLEFKRILVAECKRSGGLKLAQARTLIKIDVNKTRKLYDFLLKEGYIIQPQ